MKIEGKENKLEGEQMGRKQQSSLHHCDPNEIRSQFYKLTGSTPGILLMKVWDCESCRVVVIWNFYNIKGFITKFATNNHKSVSTKTTQLFENSRTKHSDYWRNMCGI